MDLRIFTEPQQGASFGTLLAAARSTRDSGFSAFFRSDHVMAFGIEGLPGPSDSVATLAALTALVPDIRFGTLVTSATFRHPSMLAIATANIDDISGGRIELGMGSGWFEAEHVAYGLPFGSSFGERFDRLTEQLEVITGLWSTPIGQTFSYAGTHYRLEGAPGLPKPQQRRFDGSAGVPIIIGGRGPKRTPALAARFADEFNIGFLPVEPILEQVKRVRAACESAGRDPGSLTLSIAHTTCCGRNDAEIARRADILGQSIDDLRTSGLAGTPAEIVDRLGRFAEGGITRSYLQLFDPSDLDQIELLGAEVLPQMR